MSEELERLRTENDTLRGLVAKGEGDCIYCGLAAADISKCVYGFPGCARMDDIMNAHETEKDATILDLRMRLMDLQREIKA